MSSSGDRAANRPRSQASEDRSANATHRYSRRNFWKVLGVACKGAIVVHLAFGTLFAWLGLLAMVLVNAGSVLLYIVALVLLRQRRNNVAMVLIGLEIVVHAVVAVRLLGLDSGFHFYLLVMLPLILVGPERTDVQKIALCTALLAVDVVLDLTMHRVAPSYATPVAALDALRIFNITATFLLLGSLTRVYFAAVQNAESRLHAIASTDPLTGALNRRSLLDIAEQSIANGASLSIVLSDVDHFKSVNDTHGHECGDRVLVAIYRALRGAVRPDDDVARWGGEEFVTLLPKASTVEAQTIAERARRSVEALVIPSGGGPTEVLHTTMTFGVATLVPGETPEACVARADAALYRGKAAGRNRVSLAT